MDLKEFISRLDKAGDLVRIKKPVSTKYEIFAVLGRVGKSTRQAVLFERARGHLRRLSATCCRIGEGSRSRRGAGKKCC